MNKTINEVYEQLSAVITDTYSKAMAKAIIQTDIGIVVFDQYAIVKINNGYRVVSRCTFTEAEFTSIRNALAWIIFEYKGRFKDSARVALIDSRISSLDVEINLHRRSSRRADSGKYVILLNKIQEDMSKKKELSDELERYLRLVKEIAPTILELS